MARSGSANARLSPLASALPGDGRGRVAVPGMGRVCHRERSLVFRYRHDHWGSICQGNIPLDELLFFLVIPLASILTLEAVRSVKGWPVGDGSDR